MLHCFFFLVSTSSIGRALPAFNCGGNEHRRKMREWEYGLDEQQDERAEQSGNYSRPCRQSSRCHQQNPGKQVTQRCSATDWSWCHFSRVLDSRPVKTESMVSNCWQSSQQGIVKTITVPCWKDVTVWLRSKLHLKIDAGHFFLFCFFDI